MSFLIRSDAKINLSLRVTGKRPDGYHELRSLFFRLPAVELLTITPQYDHNVKDSISVSGETVSGRNLLEDVVCRARENMVFPPLHINLVKTIPPGSGMGGGSGNAAALLAWLRRIGGDNCPGPEDFGSDVPFLFSEASWALVSGRGENMAPVPSPPEIPLVLVAVPSWEMSTKKAFSLLSESNGGHFPLNEHEAEREIGKLLDDFRRKRKVGLLPNDFYTVLQPMHPEYRNLFDAFREHGASGWGVTGSGSGCFGLFYEKKGLGGLFREMTRYDWIRKILCLE